VQIAKKIVNDFKKFCYDDVIYTCVNTDKIIIEMTFDIFKHIDVTRNPSVTFD
jgi:hypothetical protein